MYYYTIEANGVCFKVVKGSNAGSDSRDICNWYLDSGKFNKNFLLSLGEAEETNSFFYRTMGYYPCIVGYDKRYINQTEFYALVDKVDSREQIDKYVNTLSQEEKDYLLEILV